MHLEIRNLVVVYEFIRNICFVRWQQCETFDNFHKVKSILVETAKMGT